MIKDYQYKQRGSCRVPQCHRTAVPNDDSGNSDVWNYCAVEMRYFGNKCFFMKGGAL